MLKSKAVSLQNLLTLILLMGLAAGILLVAKPLVNVRENSYVFPTGTVTIQGDKGKTVSQARPVSTLRAVEAPSQTRPAVAEKFQLAPVETPPLTITPPGIVYQFTPPYPEEAIEAGLEGTTFVKALIAADGSVSEIIVEQSSGHRILDEAAALAVSQWKFSPALQGKDATKAWYKVPVTFKLS